MEELERTYLAKELPPDLEKSKSKDMVDIYIPVSANHPHLRIRHRGDTYEITNKQPMHEGDASRSIEHTIALTPEEFNELDQFPGKRVYKKRYYYSVDGRDYEIDVFQKNLAGLVLVDIEFTSIEDKDSFTSPSFCGAEVTQEDFIAGGLLAGKSYSDIEEKLTYFGYKKLII